MRNFNLTSVFFTALSFLFASSTNAETTELYGQEIMTHVDSEVSVDLVRWENRTISISLQTNCWFGDTYTTDGKPQCESSMLFDAKDDTSVLNVMKGGELRPIHMVYDPGFEEFVQEKDFVITLEIPALNSGSDNINTELVTYSLPNFNQVLHDSKTVALEAAVSRINKDRTTLIISVIFLLLLAAFIIRQFIKRQKV
ncbi:hypothetical protein P7F88_08790 [Vibrio hannami]|uniref:hypothetical protein n=1 Tax=Vibrio hannami TaxID=2717094 RepID=UPI00240EF2C9|nr:hypothetical protein [Vibrio hannami]MDG3086193.1 hypothetical protein [Vibrio hannami]